MAYINLSESLALVVRALDGECAEVAITVLEEAADILRKLTVEPNSAMPSSTVFNVNCAGSESVNAKSFIDKIKGFTNGLGLGI